MRESYSIPLVGTYYHPPAKAVIPLLPMGTELVLEPDVDNPYDRFAVRVLVRPRSIPEVELPALREALPQWGLDLDEVMAQHLLFLGHVAASHSQGVTEAIATDPEHSATLGCTPDGKPLVVLTIEVSSNPAPDQESEGE